MRNFYYSMMLYIEKYPLNLECGKLLDMVDEICFLLGCDYDKFGYVLLHPDYDFKDLGKMMTKRVDTKEKFRNLKIPLKYYGKLDDMPSSPSICFQLSSNSIFADSEFSVDFSYPCLNELYLQVEIQINRALMNKRFTLDIFRKIQHIFMVNQYEINTAFLHYYFGNGHNIILSGVGHSFMTINDERILNHAMDYTKSWKNRIMDVFYINSIRRGALSGKLIDRIRKSVGNKNMIEEDDMIIFKLPQWHFVYLLNRVIPTWSRQKLKNILKKEGLCSEDVSILRALLK